MKVLFQPSTTKASKNSWSDGTLTMGSKPNTSETADPHSKTFPNKALSPQQWTRKRTSSIWSSMVPWGQCKTKCFRKSVLKNLSASESITSSPHSSAISIRSTVPLKSPSWFWDKAELERNLWWISTTRTIKATLTFIRSECQWKTYQERIIMSMLIF